MEIESSGLRMDGLHKIFQFEVYGLPLILISMKAFKIVLSALCTLLFTFSTNAQKTLSLRECVDLLIKNNLLYRESQLQAQGSVAQLQQTKSLQLPQLGFNAGQNLNFGRSIDRS